MKLFSLCIALAVFCESHAEMTVSGTISSPDSGKSLTFNVPFDCWLHPGNSTEILPDKKGRFSIRLPVEKPQIFFLVYAGKRLDLYGEPGKTLVLKADDAFNTIGFGGSLGQENQFREWLGLTRFSLGKQAWNDSISKPEEIFSDLKKAQHSALSILKAGRFEPSSSFFRMTQADIQYFAVSKLWALIWQNGVWTEKNRSRYGRNEWRETLKSAHESLRLSNADALMSYHYQTMVSYYPRYLQQLASGKEEFARIAESVFKKPFAEINLEVRLKGKRYWDHAALQYGFDGPALEYALASFLINGIDMGELQYQQEAYGDFVKRFPDSRYRNAVQQKIGPYLASLLRTDPEPDGIRFVPDSLNLTSLDSVIAGHRGRVIFIDIWGTWCGPCRQEFSFNQALKEQFKDKAVDFAYIAVEHRPDPEQGWREMIKFYHLTGYHILAGKELEKDLAKIYAQQGHLRFPSYILVDKLGKIVTIHAKRPSDRKALYRQIEQFL